MTDLKDDFGSGKECYNTEDKRYHKIARDPPIRYSMAMDAELCNIPSSDDKDLCIYFSGFHKVAHNIIVDFESCNICRDDAIQDPTIIHQFSIKESNQNNVLYHHLKKCHFVEYTVIEKTVCTIIISPQQRRQS